MSTVWEAFPFAPPSRLVTAARSHILSYSRNRACNAGQQISASRGSEHGNPNKDGTELESNRNVRTLGITRPQDEPGNGDMAWVEARKRESSRRILRAAFKHVIGNAQYIECADASEDDYEDDDRDGDDEDGSGDERGPGDDENAEDDREGIRGGDDGYWRVGGYVYAAAAGDWECDWDMEKASTAGITTFGATHAIQPGTGLPGNSTQSRNGGEHGSASLESLLTAQELDDLLDSMERDEGGFKRGSRRDLETATPVDGGEGLASRSGALSKADHWQEALELATAGWIERIANKDPWWAATLVPNCALYGDPGAEYTLFLTQHHRHEWVAFVMQARLRARSVHEVSSDAPNMDPGLGAEVYPVNAPKLKSEERLHALEKAAQPTHPHPPLRSALIPPADDDGDEAIARQHSKQASPLDVIPSSDPVASSSLLSATSVPSLGTSVHFNGSPGSHSHVHADAAVLSAIACPPIAGTAPAAACNTTSTAPASDASTSASATGSYSVGTAEGPDDEPPRIPTKRPAEPVPAAPVELTANSQKSLESGPGSPKRARTAVMLHHGSGSIANSVSMGERIAFTTGMRQDIAPDRCPPREHVGRSPSRDRTAVSAERRYTIEKDISGRASGLGEANADITIVGSSAFQEEYEQEDDGCHDGGEETSDSQVAGQGYVDGDKVDQGDRQDYTLRKRLAISSTALFDNRGAIMGTEAAVARAAAVQEHIVQTQSRLPSATSNGSRAETDHISEIPPVNGPRAPSHCKRAHEAERSATDGKARGPKVMIESASVEYAETECCAPSNEPQRLPSPQRVLPRPPLLDPLACPPSSSSTEMQGATSETLPLSKPVARPVSVPAADRKSPVDSTTVSVPPVSASDAIEPRDEELRLVGGRSEDVDMLQGAQTKRKGRPGRPRKPESRAKRLRAQQVLSQLHRDRVHKLNLACGSLIRQLGEIVSVHRHDGWPDHLSGGEHAISSPLSAIPSGTWPHVGEAGPQLSTPSSRASPQPSWFSQSFGSLRDDSDNAYRLYVIRQLLAKHVTDIEDICPQEALPNDLTLPLKWLSGDPLASVSAAEDDDTGTSAGRGTARAKESGAVGTRSKKVSPREPTFPTIGIQGCRKLALQLRYDLGMEIALAVQEDDDSESRSGQSDVGEQPAPAPTFGSPPSASSVKNDQDPVPSDPAYTDNAVGGLNPRFVRDSSEQQRDDISESPVSDSQDLPRPEPSTSSIPMEIRSLGPYSAGMVRLSPLAQVPVRARPVDQTGITQSDRPAERRFGSVLFEDRARANMSMFPSQQAGFNTLAGVS